MGLCVRKSLKYYQQPDLEFISADFENLFIEVHTASGKNTIVGVVYRHPTPNINEFQVQFLNTLNKLNHAKQGYVICGDFNIDLKSDTSNTNYLNALHSEGCINVITKPTRITATSATLLDHIYTNLTRNIAKRAILTYEISDHLPTFYTVKIKSTVEKSRSIIRDIKNFDK